MKLTRYLKDIFHENILLCENTSINPVLFKHYNNRDVAFKITSFTNDENFYEIKVEWFNVVNAPYVTKIGPDIIKIKIPDLDKWESFFV